MSVYTDFLAIYSPPGEGTDLVDTNLVQAHSHGIADPGHNHGIPDLDADGMIDDMLSRDAIGHLTGNHKTPAEEPTERKSDCALLRAIGRTK